MFINPRIIAFTSFDSIIISSRLISGSRLASFNTVNCVTNSLAEPLENSRNLLNSLSVPLSAPSAIFDGIETEEAEMKL